MTEDERHQRNLRAIALIETFLNGDDELQADTWEFLKEALDENRGPDEKLFV